MQKPSHFTCTGAETSLGPKERPNLPFADSQFFAAAGIFHNQSHNTSVSKTEKRGSDDCANQVKSRE